MAEVSKESINEDVSVENTDNAEIVNESTVETKATSTEVNVNKDTVNNKPSDSNDADVHSTESSHSSNKDDKDTECSSETAIQQVDDDSVTIISENEKVLISLDVDKLSEGISETERPSADVNDTDNDVVEVTTSHSTSPVINELNVEEGGEWSVKSRLQSFIKWSRSKGLNISPKVEVKCEGTCHRYGMVATSNIKKGETIFTISRSLIFNPDNSRIVAEIVDYEDWLDSIGQSLDDSSGWATLLIALMVEYNDVDSFWAPYLRLVPKPEECGHPLFWSIEEHKEELRGTTLLYDIQRDIYNIESEYKQFILPFIYRYKDICGTVERYSLALYKRLVAFVMSYSFTEDFDSEPSMIPMADILNHSTNTNAKLIFGDENVEVIAIKNINKGEEIFNTFGKLGNAELLQTYGYADKEPNIYDTFPILVNTFLDVMEKEKKVSESYFQAKVTLLNKTEIAHSDDYFLFDRNGMRKGPDLVQMLKILFMPESEFDELLKSRAGNRPDSFYQKLLRKLKLSKKTDTSSGVAIIDITDEEPEQEPAPKRKMDVELHEIDDSEPPTKQVCDMPLMHIPVVQLSQTHPERSFPLSMLQPDNGNSICNAIVIDDDDSDDEKVEDNNSSDKTKSDTADEKQNDNNDKKEDDTLESEKSNVSSVDESANLHPSSEESLLKDNPLESEKMEVESVVNNSATADKPAEEVVVEKPAEEVVVEKPAEEVVVDKPEKRVDEKSEDSNSPVNKEDNEEDSNKTSDTLECDSVDKVGEKSDEKDKNTEESTKCEKSEEQQKDSTSNNEIHEIKDSPIVNKQDADVLSIGDDIDDDERDSDVDDIEIVSEDIRCKMTYEILNKDMKPEWKEFITSVVNFQTNGLKPDEHLTAAEAREKMSDRQFFSYQIRQGQRLVAKTFLSTLNATILEK